jgi:hypothetical protein
MLECGYTLCAYISAEDAMKDVGMRIRVEPELREQFISLCHEHNVPAAQVLRSFMRDFVQGSNSKNKTRLQQVANPAAQLMPKTKTR